MEQFIKGNWKAGWAMDLHTISCFKNSDGSFDTIRSEIGELVYKLKYQQDNTTIIKLSHMVATFMKSRRIFNYIDAIIPVPPSKDRSLQPVPEIALEVGELTGKKVDTNYIQKLKSTSELKSIINPDERAKILENAFGVIDNRYEGKNVLLFDDLYRSGTTLKELTNLLYKYGKVKNVYIITMTKTRVNR
ncbi:hypothetical protein N5T78_08150 [Aliarcobacter cryaerophilus]|uniref:ComF family protein n=1 Tax=Aliarcobacter cryaerophilus TaxID=28198 RepID=UPI0021B61D59|nr:hypothetical protein [Aliarcobacter cryaerophilus]MCT7466546.1 hypothetical protein [Aliarcobacter cryaerophilus]